MKGQFFNRINHEIFPVWRKLTLTRFGVYLVLLLVVSILASGCEPGGSLQIQNLQNQEVTIFLASVRTDGTIDELTKQMVISANTTRTLEITFLGSEWVNRIQAVDPSGKVIFSHDYKMSDLEKMDWKIVIPP